VTRFGRADSPGVASLASLPDGATAQLVTVQGGAGLRSRLAAMGLHAGIEVRVVHNGGHGPFVLASGESRIVLGRGMARRVMVIPTRPDGSGTGNRTGTTAPPE
jgi:ferrous iron transport protein A